MNNFHTCSVRIQVQNNQNKSRDSPSRYGEFKDYSANSTVPEKSGHYESTLFVNSTNFINGSFQLLRVVEAGSQMTYLGCFVSVFGQKVVQYCLNSINSHAGKCRYLVFVCSK